MAADLTDVLVAGYPDIDRATKDFEALIAQVKARPCASRAPSSSPTASMAQVLVQQTGDDLGRKGAGYGGAVGVLVGPRGAAAAGVRGDRRRGRRHVLGKLASHKVEQGIHDKIGESAASRAPRASSRCSTRASGFGVEQALSRRASCGPWPSRTRRAPRRSRTRSRRRWARSSPTAPSCPSRTASSAARSAATWTRRSATGRSSPARPRRKARPNVLIVLVDDAGYGGPDTFGGDIRTPNLTRVQQMGLTYNRFHVTAVCSPTRAALLTGRNHHRVGMGGIAEFPGPFPGYTGQLPRTTAPLPKILKGNGYVTGGFGKWHLTPGRAMGPAGPYDRWPQAWGFDHWWGFLTGAAGQYDPVVVQDNTVIGVPEGKDGELYYFPDDITDKAVEWIHSVRAHDAHKPWFVYYSTGATHAPHHVAKEWADKYKGQFDDGWDAYRERTLARQKRLGIVPPETELAPRPEAYPAWDTLERRAEAALRAPDGGVRGLLRERRLEHRPLPRRGRGDGRAGQHADLLHLGRQRRLDGGDHHRLLQRDDVLQRPRAGGGPAARAHREVRWPRGPGRRAQRTALRGGLGARPEHALPVGQADGQPPGRRPRPDGRRVAQAHPGGRRGPLPVHARHRRGARPSWS